MKQPTNPPSHPLPTGRRRLPRSEALPYGPISRLSHGSPNVGSTFRKTGIAGKIIVFEGALNSVVSHAICESCNTEGDVCRSRPIRISGRGTEPLQRYEPPSPLGRKRSLLPTHLSLLFLGFVQLGDLLVKGKSHRVLHPGMADEPNEREETIRFAVLGFAIGEAGQSTESTPAGSAQIGLVASRQELRSETSNQLGNTTVCLSQTWKLPTLVSTTAQGSKPSAESLASEVSLRSSSTV